jgi:hypothetical protein
MKLGLHSDDETPTGGPEVEAPRKVSGPMHEAGIAPERQNCITVSATRTGYLWAGGAAVPTKMNDYDNKTRISYPNLRLKEEVRVKRVKLSL